MKTKDFHIAIAMFMVIVTLIAVGIAALCIKRDKGDHRHHREHPAAERCERYEERCDRDRSDYRRFDDDQPRWWRDRVPRYDEVWDDESRIAELEEEADARIAELEEEADALTAELEDVLSELRELR